MKPWDVIVIGAGPAGCASALFLHRQGYRVLVLEQARFPREKVCGEFISPAADEILAELGLLELVEAREPLRLRGVAISAYGGPELCIDYPPHPGNEGRMSSLSLPRTLLDPLLLDQTRARGIEVREEHRVDDFLFENNQVCGVRGWDAGRRPFTLKARVVVDAGGRNGLALRRLSLKREGRGARRVALAAHWRGAQFPGDYCYMHISPPGYTGMAPVGNNAANVVLVVDRRELERNSPEEFYARSVLRNPLRRRILKYARIDHEVRAVGSLAYEVDKVPCGGLVLVGDAMGFIDPFTGEGIYLALRSAQLASGVIDQAFKTGDFSSEGLDRYRQIRQQEFNDKFRLSRILQKILYRPTLCRAVVALLGRNPDAAGRLVGVIGDYLPAEDLFTAGFLKELIFGMRFAEGGPAHGGTEKKTAFSPILRRGEKP